MYANAASLPADRKDYAAFFRWENFVGDALAAEAFLASQATVDARRLALLGHSEGGLLPLVAAQTLQQQGRPRAALEIASTYGGKACVSTRRSRWSQDHAKKQTYNKQRTP